MAIWLPGIRNIIWNELLQVGSSLVWQQERDLFASSPGQVLSLCKQGMRYVYSGLYFHLPLMITGCVWDLDASQPDNGLRLFLFRKGFAQWTAFLFSLLVILNQSLPWLSICRCRILQI